MKLRIYLAVLLALAPAMAFAKPKGGGTRMRSQIFRDRAPKAHVREGHPHEIRMRPAKSAPPPAAVKEDF